MSSAGDHDAMPEPTSLGDLLTWRAEASPDAVAYTYLRDGELDAVTLTYRQLDAEAQRVAAGLRGWARPGDRVLLVLESGLGYLAALFGCLVAGVVAVPALPPRGAAGRDRLRTIAADCDPAVVLVATRDERQQWCSTAELPGRAQWVSLDELSATQERLGWRSTTDDLALLQYTSGSTSKPRGVALSHRNLLHNLTLIRAAFGQSSRSRAVIWLPPHHDMGLIGGLLQPMFAGFPAVLLSPLAFMRRPLRWLQAIARSSATTSGGPNFAYELCVRSIPARDRNELDLSSWEVAFCGAEPVRAQTLERFVDAFGPCGFRAEALVPCYGLAEATLFVSGTRRARGPRIERFSGDDLGNGRAVVVAEDERSRSLVGCGQVPTEQRLIVVDPTTGRRRNAGEIGELWVTGPSVARGYWGQDADTNFAARCEPDDGFAYLRTGDLGFVLDGDVFVTGRLKDVLVVRGRNIHAEDLETTIEAASAGLRPSSTAVFAVDSERGETIVAVCEVERLARAIDIDVIGPEIRSRVAQGHGVFLDEIMLVKGGTLPRTTSGKVQRHACRQLYVADGFAAIARDHGQARADVDPMDGADDDDGVGRALLVDRSSAERRAVLGGWLSRRIAMLTGSGQRDLGLERPLVELGLDSLMAAQLQHAIERQWGVTVDLSQILGGGATVAELIEACLARLGATGPADELDASARSKAPTGTLSRGQRALWYAQRCAPASPVYNIAAALRLAPTVSVERLRRAVDGVVARHGLLHCTFAVTDGEPRSVPLARDDDRWPTLKVQRCEGVGLEGLRRAAQALAEQPFDLERGSPVRFRLLHDGGSTFVLAVVVHHLVVDLWSLTRLLDELGRAYDGEMPLEPSASTYDDYVAWQERNLAGASGLRARDHWQRVLGGSPPVLELPCDDRRPKSKTFRGATIEGTVEGTRYARAKAFCRQRGLTLNVLLLSAYALMLRHYSRQDELIIGCPANGRTQSRFDDVIGYFVNPLPMRLRLDRRHTGSELLEQTRAALLQALDHQDFPFASMVEHVGPPRDVGRSPVFDAMFVMQQANGPTAAGVLAVAMGTTGAPMRLGSLECTSMGIDTRAAEHDLTLFAADTGAELAFVARYAEDLLESGTIARMVKHFETIVDALVLDPNRPLDGLNASSVVPSVSLNQQVEARAFVGVHERILATAARTPDAAAVVGRDTTLGYGELVRVSARVAAALVRRGVSVESRIAVCLDRTPSMVAVLLGILRAGATYVPIDPRLPADRRAFVLKDAECTLSIVSRRGDEGSGATVCVDELLAEPGEVSRAAVVCPENLAYVLYTSGSTGRPKGVAITHRSVEAFVDWIAEEFTREELAGVLASTTLAFDLSVFELFGPLTVGGRVILAEDLLDLTDLPARSSVTLINTVPSLARELLARGALPPSVVCFNCAGEPLTASLANDIYRSSKVQRVNNLYGPSETTTYSTWRVVEREARRDPAIGHPIARTSVYVLDDEMRPVAPGAPGELYIGGLGLARGYVGRRSLTAERFVPDPFGAEGSRLYRTGDLVRVRNDGSLEYLGRTDTQVKLRGLRVETGEIEQAIAETGLVQDAAVVVDVRGTSLVAFVVVGTAELDSARLRNALTRWLPQYMVPAIFEAVPALPRTTSGKIDRGALRARTSMWGSAERRIVEPRTETEARVLQIWRGLLEQNQVGVEHDFFESGGHSLMASTMLARIAKTFEVEIGLADVFDLRTVATLAQRIDTLRWLTSGTDEVGHAPGELDMGRL